MSLLERLKAKEGSTHSRKRVGRGQGSGLGQTSGKGHKGQTARSGGKIRRGFEGGQTPLVRRLPKFGFKSPFPTKYTVVNLDQLANMGDDVTLEMLNQLAGPGKVKVLARGQVAKAVVVRAHKFSDKAKAAIEAAGGKAEVV
jgi:large subunit ribosomal protein L15